MRKGTIIKRNKKRQSEIAFFISKCTNNAVLNLRKRFATTIKFDITQVCDLIVTYAS